MNEYLLHSKRCFIDAHFMDATLHIMNGRIHEVYLGIKKLGTFEFIDYGNLILMPGIIDVHVHINEPGRSHWEGFDSATKAAALGGITTLIEMPLNAHPVTTTVEAFQLKIKAAKNKLHVHCGFYGGVIPGNEFEIEGLIKSGVFGIKGFLIHSGIDEFPNCSEDDLEKIAPTLKKYKLPLLLHCELSNAAAPEVSDPGSYREYLNSRPQQWEIDAIDLAIRIQKKYNIRVHIVHLAASLALKRIQQYQQKTDRLTVETCPHYLFFNAEHIPDKNPLYKCAPPIRTKKNNDKLWDFLMNDGFNFICSDHSPVPPNLKKMNEGNLSDAWGGIAGMQLLLPVLWTAGKNRGLTLEKLIPLLTSKPAEFLGLHAKKGRLQKGFDADIVVWDEKKEFTVVKEIIAHKHKASPYLNQKLYGQILQTMVGGKQVVRDGKIVHLNAGELLLKKSIKVLTNT